MELLCFFYKVGGIIMTLYLFHANEVSISFISIYLHITSTITFELFYGLTDFH
jgi:hypothetical protein